MTSALGRQAVTSRPEGRPLRWRGSSPWGDATSTGDQFDRDLTPGPGAKLVSAHEPRRNDQQPPRRLLLSLLAMFNPSLLAAVTVMLLLPNPKRLMVGYLLGAYTTSITLGLVIVFSLHNSSTESTSKHKVSPVEDIVVGLLALAIAFVLRTDATNRFKSADGRRRTPS
jgi:Sap, sulfolipid-1-addressing protein